MVELILPWRIHREVVTYMYYMKGDVEGGGGGGGGGGGEGRSVPLCSKWHTLPEHISVSIS